MPVGSGVLDPSMPAGAHAKVPMDLSVLVLVPPSAVFLFFLPFSSLHGYRSLQQNSLSESTEKGREREGGRRGGWRGRGGYFNTIWPYHLDSRARPYCLIDYYYY